MDTTLTRKPAVAGQFYPGDAVQLRSQVREFMEASGVEPAPEGVAALVAPHAGYPFSGPTAGCAYRRVQGKQPRRVVLMGVSHRFAIPQASVYHRGGFETPLGAFPIDEEFARRLMEETGAYSIEPHMDEHSLEVQLPFLHAAVGERPIVPVLFGAPASEWHAQLGRRLAEMVDKDDLLVVSTDLSHFLSEEEANAKDNASLQGALSQDWAQFTRGIAEGRYSMCGATAVAVGMCYALARGAAEWDVLDYRTSAQASGDTRRVVGYAAISMEFG